MTGIKCIMEIMEEKGYIKTRETAISSKEIPSYIFFMTNEVKDDDIKKTMYETIKIALEENLEYLSRDNMFCKKKDIDNYIEPLIELNQEVTKRIALEGFIQEYILSKYPNIELPHMEILNLDIRKKRLKDEYNKDMEALEFLYSIL